MKNNMSIQMDFQCDENWDQMTPDKQGRYCDRCSLSLIDFTVMSGPQIIGYFQNYKGKTCGRITKDQIQSVNDVLAISDQSRFRVYLNSVLFAGFLTLASCKSQESVICDISKRHISSYSIIENPSMLFHNILCVHGDNERHRF